ncbi:unnamed protein product [Bursaphelenchus okinawaensis]|uniref:Uncharacterized protein n=1 Tax=Bursaphelenchus okinawaensis TaxID=465554 RepID=A0A811KJK3_9BILA|nr:unnamed protein product [Bursaphelenchus okinawaensis]CAG9103821.1 unnamed protein product [Bursaphelenchus okinawaensis]
MYLHLSPCLGDVPQHFQSKYLLGFNLLALNYFAVNPNSKYITSQLIVPLNRDGNAHKYGRILIKKSHRWVEQRGRLEGPLLARSSSSHTSPISSFCSLLLHQNKHKASSTVNKCESQQSYQTAFKNGYTVTKKPDSLSKKERNRRKRRPIYFCRCLFAIRPSGFIRAWFQKFFSVHSAIAADHEEQNSVF